MSRNYLIIFLKGIAFGIANVIPGVSGGTIALITGIFERLINSLKSFDVQALKLLMQGKLRSFAQKTDFWFLLSLGLGVLFAVISVAKLFKYLFEHYPVYIWSFFFGLILASVYFVAKRIHKWNAGVIVSLIVGIAIAIFISLTNPAVENRSFIYLIICGAVSVCGMLLPGISGSFILILMGNYELVMINSVNELDFGVLLPVVIGVVGGLVAFSHLLSWLFKTYKDQTLAILTGFIIGSLSILWPWKTAIEENIGGKIKTVGYHWNTPNMNAEFFIALLCMVLGIIMIWLLERTGQEKA